MIASRVYNAMAALLTSIVDHGGECFNDIARAHMQEMY